MAPGIVLFAAGGPLAADLSESCARLGLPILGAIRNRPGPVFTDPAPLFDAGELPARLRGRPFACPLFTPANRRDAVAEAVALGLLPAAPVLDPTAILSPSARWGEGCYANTGVLVGAACRFGRFVLVNRGAGIGHHAEIGDFVAIGPGAILAGQVVVEEAAMIGAGAILSPGIRIGAGAVVAPGAVVRRDVPAGSLVAGNPARAMRRAG